MKPYKSFLFVAVIGLICVLLTQSCKHAVPTAETYCTEADFKTMKKIDIHCHITADRHDFMEQAVADNFRILTINTDAFEHPTVEEQQQFALAQMQVFPNDLHYLTAFSIKGWDEPGWQEQVIARIDSSFQRGALGVKVWKNIGMVEKDKNGQFIMIDNPRFDPIFDHIEKMGKAVCGHLGEPRNCWLPLDSMTVNNDRKYFEENPQYHMYLHPDYPSYEDQIRARDNMLNKHPNLRFMGAHLGSLEWSVDELAKYFDAFPNASVDMAARMCHLEKQAQDDWQKVHDFFITYQDRIIYGTDEGDYEGAPADPNEMKAKVDTVWTRDWKFLTTDAEMSSWEVNGSFKGLKLPKSVIEKIYYKNAEKWFPGV